MLQNEYFDSQNYTTPTDGVISSVGQACNIDTSKGESVVQGIVVQPCKELNKHPLHNTWTLWYLETDRTKAWEDMQNEITSFDTVEDFWCLYNHVKPPSQLKIGSDYSLFKKGIRPMWEDEKNKDGGRWVITIHKNYKAELDTLWLDVLLCLIGEGLEHSDDICGAVVNIRNRHNKISVWTGAGNHSYALDIGMQLKEILCLERLNLQYQLHKDTMCKQGTTVKSVYNL